MQVRADGAVAVRAVVLRAGVLAGWMGVALGAWVCADAGGALGSVPSPWPDTAPMPGALAMFVGLAALGATASRWSPASAMAPFYISGSVGFALAGTAWVLPGALLLAAAFAILAGLEA